MLVQSASLLYKKKTSGIKVRRTPDVRLRFVGFNFGQVQLLRFVVVMIRSYSFGLSSEYSSAITPLDILLKD